ncbi:DUF6134 family protein [Roseomonas sp. CCTCC AB2023176]|uniref:DUF6134 family protein n=1 Tax=Roseomonas sp. CCTCC AB2023176 TaxID=3342640 RepID=UPI0035DB8862
MRNITTRRLLLAAPVLLSPALALAAPPGGYRWRILRDGTQIGTHRVTLSGDAATRTAATEVEIVVRLAGFTVYRYTHSFSETWAGDRLLALRSRSDRNGTQGALNVRREGEVLMAEGGPDGTLRLPGNAAPLSWWDPAVLARPLFDAATGRAEAALVREGPPNGPSRWRLTAAPNSEATYDAAGNWTGYGTRGADGSAVTYAAL